MHASAERWQNALVQIQTGEMPPEKQPRPAAPEIQAVTEWLVAQLRDGEARRSGAVLRRLNRREYQNTLRDLLGIQIDVTSDLPEDPTQFGFDTVGSALSISTAHMRQYALVARQALDLAIVTEPKPPKRILQWFMRGEATPKEYEEAAKVMGLPGFKQGWGIEGRDKAIGAGYAPRTLIPMNGLTSVGLDGGNKIHFALYENGVYAIRAKCGARENSAIPGTPRITVAFKSSIVLDKAVENPIDKTEVYEVLLPMRKGDAEMVAFNGLVPPPDKYVGQPHKLSTEKHNEIRERSPLLVIDYLEIDGPICESWPPPSHTRIFFKRKRSD